MEDERRNAYPSSSLYREHAEEVSEEAEKLYARFVEDNDGDERKTIGRMLGVEEGEEDLLSDEEVADVKKAVRYILKRLIVSGMYSPRKAEERTDSDFIQNLAQRGIDLTEWHDVVHGAIAYARQAHRSMRPKYDKIAEEEQDTDTAGEEILALALQRNSDDEVDIISHFANGGRPDRYQRRHPRTFDDAQLAALNKLYEEGAPSSDPARYLAEAFKHAMSGFGKTDLWEKQDPVFVSVIRTLAENARKDEPDPLVGVHIFLDLVRPLLERSKNAGAA